MQQQGVYDVIQVGYGPVSEVLAIQLGRLGYSVGVFERWTERYQLPRAVCIDHEMFRMLSAIGMRDDLPAVSHPAPPYRWFNADWEELLAIDWSAESISGGSDVNFIHQPTVEAMFDSAARRQPTVEINLGWEAVAVRQTAEYAELDVRNTAGGEIRTVRARYLIGCDGANSLVRSAIGATQDDLGFEADWLVVDVLPNEGVTLNVPAAAQYCNPSRPTTIVPAGIKDGRYYRRWEFMRMPGESKETLETPEMAWRLLSNWVKPEQAVMVRHKVYNFRSLIADKWRAGRLLIAGDAAHVMPPFMGQGMCAGFRDGWNLAWKLDMVLSGKTSDRLLESYQRERRPHAEAVIKLSMYLGKIICIPDPAAAARRDAQFLGGTAEMPPPFPHLIDGLLERNPATGQPSAVAGLLAPHGTVRRQEKSGRFDDLVGVGFMLIARAPLADISLDAARQKRLAGIGLTFVHMVPEGAEVTGCTVDLDRKFLPFMEQHDLAAMLVRPDFYLYGGVAHVGDIAALLDRFDGDLQAYGLDPDSVVRPGQQPPSKKLQKDADRASA